MHSKVRGKDPEVEILRLLKSDPGAFFSGQAISRELDMTRSAVWKHIEALRSYGFDVQAVPSRGYRLSTISSSYTHLNLSAALSTRFVGKELLFKGSTVSTNADARELARNGAPEGAVAMADSQTLGKGRLGRTWASPSGVNLYASIVLRPQLRPAEAHKLTFLSAVALAEALDENARDVTVKWPNDLLIRGKKTAGILLEMDSEPDRVNFVIVGIGVNLNMEADALPIEVKKTATSVYMSTGKKVDRIAFATTLFSKFEQWYMLFKKEGFGPIMTEWKKRFDRVGSIVSVRSFDSVIKGTCLGIDEDGALLLADGSNGKVRVVSGDMTA